MLVLLYSIFMLAILVYIYFMQRHIEKLEEENAFLKEHVEYLKDKIARMDWIKNS